MLVIWVSILGLVTGVQMVKENLNNQSNASKLSSGTESCGKAHLSSSKFRPVSDLCFEGSPVWTDSVADDGNFDWMCVDDEGGLLGECKAFLEE